MKAESPKTQNCICWNGKRMQDFSDQRLVIACISSHESSGVHCWVHYRGYEVVGVYGHSNEKYRDTKEQIDEFLALKEAVLLYAPKPANVLLVQSVEIVVVRSKAIKVLKRNPKIWN